MSKAENSNSNRNLEKPTLFQLADERRGLIDLVIANHGEVDDDLYNALVESDLKLEGKVEGYLAVLDHLEDREARARTYATQVKAYAEACERMSKQIRARLAVGLKTADKKSIKAGFRTVSVQSGRASVDITDLDKIPTGFADVVIVEQVKPDKARIKIALEAGQEVPGARLVYGEDSLRITSPRAKEEQLEGATTDA